VLEHGDNVVATARDAAKVKDFGRSHPNSALALSLDVTDHRQVAETVHAAEDRFGSVDVLVNNAGYGFRAAVEEAEDNEFQVLFATNFFAQLQ